jgi:hypothetical protein
LVSLARAGVEVTELPNQAAEALLAFTGNLVRSAFTRAAFALSDTNSSGETPFLHASQNVANSRTAVITKFGQAFSAH